MIGIGMMFDLRPALCFYGLATVVLIDSHIRPVLSIGATAIRLASTYVTPALLYAYAATSILSDDL